MSTNMSRVMTGAEFMAAFQQSMRAADWHANPANWHRFRAVYWRNEQKWVVEEHGRHGIRVKAPTLKEALHKARLAREARDQLLKARYMVHITKRTANRA